MKTGTISAILKEVGKWPEDVKILINRAIVRVGDIIAYIDFIFFVENVLIFEVFIFEWQNNCINLVTSCKFKKKEFEIDEFRIDVFEERLSDWIDASILFPTDKNVYWMLLRFQN